MSRESRNPSRLPPRAVLIATIAAIVGGVQAGAPEPAAAIPGLQRTVHSSLLNDNGSKWTFAECPADKHVIGGGARVYDGGRKLVRLVAMRPSSSPTGEYEDRFFVMAEAPNRSSDYDWDVTAYAICADRDALSSYTIVRNYDAQYSSSAFRTDAVRCPSGTVAYSAGASVWARPANFGDGHIGLQLVRTSGPLDIARAAARVSSSSYDNEWRLTSYAVCARRQGGIHVDGAGSLGAEVTGSCDSGYKVHGPGGGGGLIDGGPVWLQKIYPHANLPRSFRTSATSSAPVRAPARRTPARA